MKKKLFSFTVLLAAALCNVGFVQAQARQNNDWFQRQQQQQRALEQQRQQQRALEQQRQQQQMREEMRQRMREEQQREMRRKLEEQQRLQRQQVRQGTTSRPGNVTPLRGNMNNRSGFTGQSTKDGRAVAVINNRVVAVPNARAGLRAGNDNFRKAQTVRLTNAQRAAISAEVQKLATSAAGGGNNGRSTGGGGSAGGGRRRGGNGSGGGGNRSGGNGPSGPNKGDLTKIFNDAAGSKKKKPPEKPTPRPTPRPAPRFTPPSP